MPRPHLRWRDTTRVAALGIALAGLVALGGCDLQEEPDLERGRELFVSKCGTCHVMTQAATSGALGPDLDAAFGAARARGMDADTVEGVVQSQIANPRPAEPEQTELYMPADLVTGRDAENVAAYIGKYAGVEGVEPPVAPGGEGGQVYANNGCASCHTMEAAGSAGNVGPNLDENLPGQEAAEVETSIVDPGADLVAGFEDLMPATYEQTIPAEELKLLVEFLVNCSGDPETKGCS